jgi:hypothetical protein
MTGFAADAERITSQFRREDSGVSLGTVQAINAETGRPS